MAIILDPDAHKALARIVGRRLKAARIACRMGEQEVADKLGHKNATQVCLAEKGEGRIPPLLSMIRYADLYGVSIDYLSGRVDDPIADPVYTNQGAIKNAVVRSIEGTIERFVDAVSNFAVTSVSNHLNDRTDMQRIADRAEELQVAYARMKELNPDFDEEIRGASRVESAIGGLVGLVRPISDRLAREKLGSEISEIEVKVDPEKFSLAPTFEPAKTCCNANV